MFPYLRSVLSVLLASHLGAQDAPRVEVPSAPNASCPIMGKKVSLPLFVDTELGRIWVCCKPCFKKILANVPAAHQTAYPVVVDANNTTCPMTGTALGEPAVTLTLQSQRFRVCCSECATQARANSQLVLAKLAQPKLVDVGNTTCPVRGTKVAANTFVVVGDQIVHLADSKAVEVVKQTPRELLQKAIELAKAQPPRPPHVPQPAPPPPMPGTPAAPAKPEGKQ